MVCVGRHTPCVCGCPQKSEGGTGSPEAGVPGGREFPDLGAGNGTQVLRKRSQCSRRRRSHVSDLLTEIPEAAASVVSLTHVSTNPVHWLPTELLKLSICDKLA